MTSQNNVSPNLPIAAALSPEDRIRFVAENPFDLVAEVDLKGRYCYVSPNHENVVGFKPEELLGARPLQRVHPEDLERINQKWSDMIHRREGRADFRYRNKAGEWRWLEGTGRLLHHPDSEPRFLLVCRDITERKLREEELSALVAVGKVINLQLEPREQIQQLASHLKPFLPFDEFFISILQDNVLVHWRGERELSGMPDPDRCQPAYPGTPVREAIEEDRLLVQNEVASPNLSRPVRSYINVPLRAGGLAIGMLHLDSYSPQVWTPGHVRLAGLVGEQVATAVWQANLLREAKNQKAALAQSNAILRATQEAAADGICLVDDNGQVVSFNKRFSQLWNLEPEQEAELQREGQVLNHVLSLLAAPDEFIDRIAYLFDHPGASARDEIRLRDGRVFERYSAPALSPASKAEKPQSFGRIWSFVDISDRKSSEERLTHQAFHDALTGLPNRLLFVDRLSRALAKSKRTQKMVAVLFLDLDRFKVVNDSLGHQKGDLLLVEVASRLTHCMRPGDTAARFGGDEFVVLLDEVVAPADATRIAERINASLQVPLLLGGHEVHVTSSIGIVMSESPEETPEDLLRKADVAMYRAKGKGRAGFEVFSEEFSAQALERLQLELELASVVKREELELYYQPLVNLQTGRVEAFEALLRWNHPRRGLTSPNLFVSLAEETGHIIAIGSWVIKQACRQGMLWSEGGATPLMHVNLSARQFEHANLPGEVDSILQETGFPANRLMLEITESAVMTDAEAAVGQLERLKALGVKLSIDDFGTGYSSLSYLEFFPIDCLKIDRTFTSRLEHGSVLVKAITMLGHAMGVEVAAEGIETEAQLEQLKELGVHWGQGYIFAMPLAHATAEKLNGQLYVSGYNWPEVP